MNYYSVRFLKDNQPQGRPYTYAFGSELSAGDKVELPNGKHGVVDGAADMEEVERFGADRIKEIVGKCEPQIIVKNWSLYVSNDNGFTAPELRHMHLQGNVYGPNGFNDGDPINTSRIVGIEDKGDHKDVITRTGSRYSVYPADVDPECEKQFPGYYERLSCNETKSV